MKKRKSVYTKSPTSEQVKELAGKVKPSDDDVDDDDSGKGRRLKLKPRGEEGGSHFRTREEGRKDVGQFREVF